MSFDDSFIPLLRCPISGERLHRDGSWLVSDSGGRRFRISQSGIPYFAEMDCSSDARTQREHYDRVSAAYLKNLESPQTQEYNRYLDRVLLEEIGPDDLGTIAEICCGHGAAFHVLADRIARGVGVDVSGSMLEEARRRHPDPRFGFLQGDATQLPLASGAFDNVLMLGGIHHVNDREKLFAQVFRILKPGGRFIWREPVSDFWPWKLGRAIVYRLSPALDHETERPLHYLETIRTLRAAGFKEQAWRTCGFLGFCVLMNGDVLVFNRILRYLPGIRAFTRLMSRLDDLALRAPGMSRAGLLVVGSACKVV